MKSVKLLGINQRFGAVTALENVDLVVEKGSIHAVVGENGAGKTTLMRILYGALRPTAGKMEVNGRPVSFETSKQAIEAGIGMVSQHYGIIPELSCIQNLILGAEGGAFIDERAAIVRAQGLADKMGFEFDWRGIASSLSPAATQKLEILKLLWRKCSTMILDEPTSMLSPADGDALFESMRRLADEGATVLLVTHRLPEVMVHCSRVTVLRAGRRVADMAVSETNPVELAQLIVGPSAAGLGELLPVAVSSGERDRNITTDAEVRLSVKGLVVGGQRGEDKLKGIDLWARRGEILGIAGVDGSGQRELFHAVVGIRPVKAGSIGFEGSDVTRASTADRIRAGLRVIPEDRHEEGVVESWSLDLNSALGLQRLSPLAHGPTVNTEARRTWAQKVADRFRTRHGGLNLPMASLSGGNQQRFVAARALEMNPSVILAFQPARGLDLGATADVYRGIREKAVAGATAVVVSFDLDELLEHCDRIVVMNGGRIYEPPPELAKDREGIGRLMVGAHPASPSSASPHGADA